MMSSSSQSKSSLLVFEPKTEGHHLPWLRMITDDLLAAGFQLILALDRRPDAWQRVQDQLAMVLPQVTVLPYCGTHEARTDDYTVDMLARCLEQSGAGQVFMPCFDEIASRVLRRAAFGGRPPESLRGRLGFIYHRPRVLAPAGFSLNHMIKRRGFVRLLGEGWFNRILLLDEFLFAAQKKSAPDLPFYFLPTPGPNVYAVSQTEARQKLGLPKEKRVFLFYGGGYKRKGLHLAVEAMLGLPQDLPAFLLCAGQQPSDASLAQALEKLIHQGRALSLNRYVSDAEEELCFCASDAVLLPYIRHFGVSAVLSQAVMAGKMVIASEEELTGRRVKDYRLGLLFPSGDARALARCIEQAARATPQGMAEYAAAVKAHAPQCTRQAFRQALLAAFGCSMAKGAVVEKI